IRDKYGRLDVVFANAGLGAVAPLAQVTEEQFDREFAVNVKGLFFTVQKALPLLSEGASIILNSSIAAYMGMEGFSVRASKVIWFVSQGAVRSRRGPHFCISVFSVPVSSDLAGASGTSKVSDGQQCVSEPLRTSHQSFHERRSSVLPVLQSSFRRTCAGSQA